MGPLNTYNANVWLFLRPCDQDTRSRDLKYKVDVYKVSQAALATGIDAERHKSAHVHKTREEVSFLRSTI